jgi:hypothetical protein
MRRFTWLAAIAIALLAAGVGVWQLAAQGGDDGYGIPAPTGTVEYIPGATPISSGRQPPPTAEPTATLDLSAAMPAAEARAALAEDPELAAILQAFEDRDVQAILSLITWQNQPCGSPRGSTDYCPPGVESLTEMEMIDVGGTVSFWVTETTLRGHLAEVLAGDDLALSFASHRTDSDTASVYFLGLEGPSRPVTPAPAWGSSDGVTGVFLTVDADLERPVLKVDFLTSGWTAAEQASNQGFVGQEIITIAD